MARSLDVGGALDLGDVACGTLDLRGIADGVQISGGREGSVVFGSGQHGISLMFSQLNQIVDAGVPRALTKLDPHRPDRQFAAKE